MTASPAARTLGHLSATEPPDLIRPILADEVVRSATIVDGIEAVIRDAKNRAAAAGLELVNARLDLRGAISTLNRHDAERRAR